jgi:hypothetical protein
MTIEKFPARRSAARSALSGLAAVHPGRVSSRSQRKSSQRLVKAPHPLLEGRGHVKLCPLRRHRRGERAALNEATLRRRSRGGRGKKGPSKSV